MNRFIQLAIVSAAAVFAAQSARAQINPGDLILGFTGSSPTTRDYVVDLGGSLDSFNAQSPTVQHLGGAVNLATFGAGGAPTIGNMNVGLIFGKASSATGDYAGFGILRTGNNAAGTAGTEGVPAKPSGGNFVTLAANAANGTTLGTPLNTDPASFTVNADPLTTGTFAQNLSSSLVLNSMVGTTIALDLFESTRLAPVGHSTPASDYAYAGTLTINLSGPNALVDFTPVAPVPEPSTYGLIAGAGLLLVSLRRQFRASVA